MFYDASKDTAAVELAEQLTTNRVRSAAEVMEAYEAAEPERQLCILCLLEVTTGDNMAELKKEAVGRLMTKLGVSEQKKQELLSK